MTSITKTTPVTAVDIMGFDALTESDSGYEFELKGTDQITGTGIYLTITGKHGKEYSKWFAKVVNAAIRDNAIAARKNQPLATKSLDENKAQHIEGTVLRVTGWRNVSQPFSRELLATVLGRNPHFVEQIVEESDNLGNFSTAKLGS